MTWTWWASLLSRTSCRTAFPLPSKPSWTPASRWPTQAALSRLKLTPTPSTQWLQRESLLAHTWLKGLLRHACTAYVKKL